MENQNNRKAARGFASAVAKAVSEALEKAIGGPWPLEVIDSAEPPTHPAKPVHYRLKVDGALRGECFLEFYEPQVEQLTKRLQVRPAAGDDSWEALTKILLTATGSVQSLLAEYGEITVKLEPVSGLAFGGMFVVPIGAPTDSSSLPVLLYFDGALLAALGGRHASKDAGTAGIDPLNLKLVMDVELNVSLRFGQRQLPLREVLDLTSGSVVELDRMVDEPVDLLLDGKLIARGEAVIVDGNYGLRVTEIPQPVASHFLQ
jgi:flagellar motor switch protein FliN